MSNKKRIYLNAFDMNCVVHQSPGLWKYPGDQADQYNTIDYWVNLAKVLEKGFFDGIFIADVIGIYDVYKNGKETTIRSATQVPVNDPILLVSAMAHATEHIGFGITASTTFEHPYTFARRMSTADHLSKGRVAWNVVTSYLESGTKNIEIGDKFQHDERYNIAEEYMEVVYKLWEGSWEDGAVVKDKTNGVFTNPNKVHEIQHEGKYFKVPGIHLCEPSPQRTPVIYQAGSSNRGIQFAAKHAECAFISVPTKEPAIQYVKSLRKEAVKQGKNPQDIKVLALATVITGKTDEEARQKYEKLLSYIDLEGALSLLSGWTGIDFSQFDPDEEIKYVETNAIQGDLSVLTEEVSGQKWTPRKVANFVGIGGLGPVFVGSAETVADLLENWIEETDADGFNLAYATIPGTFEDIVEYLIPELQKRGRFKTSYKEGTLREKLDLNDGPYMHSTHPAYQYKKLHQENH
ncbi:LLM class flavin-dependent oxidoreductase [Rummeliibacillus suwonensis]|uniref:LLM class flavin-dependent oxidoreductase n=1 Tax=Rummeliibacillus suwonensis TaxID=1306154 RepID=UPI0011B693E3|nr:LLM class flavin-dependent oxidoreductase [Rummeliibacillus suwonensis]